MIDNVTSRKNNISITESANIHLFRSTTKIYIINFAGVSLTIFNLKKIGFLKHDERYALCTSFSHMVFYHASFRDMKSAAVKKLWLPIKNVSNDRDLHPDQINKLTMGFNVSNQNFQNQLVAIVLLHTDLYLKGLLAIIFTTYVKMGYSEHILI